MNDKGLADVQAASPFRLPSFTHELVRSSAAPASRFEVEILDHDDVGTSKVEGSPVNVDRVLVTLSRGRRRLVHVQCHPVSDRRMDGPTAARGVRPRGDLGLYMVLGGAINEITDDAVARLVPGHLAERQHLEFKLTVNHREDAERLEVLLDVTSLANDGGGYLIVGIRDDGRGCAQRFENPGDTRQIAQSIYDLSMRWIDERIAGLEVRERNVQGMRL
jgi:hypothetical protein